MLLLLFLAALTSLPAHAGAPVSIHNNSVLESYGPLASSPKGERDQTTIYLGGTLEKKTEDEYRRLLNTGADPEKIPGPERLYRAPADETSPLDAAQVKTVLAIPGYNVNDPSAFRPANSQLAYLFFTRGPNKIAEACRKKGESLRTCPEYAEAREIGFATSADDGLTWDVQNIPVTAKNSGDGSGAAMPAALYVSGEVWLYYTTGLQNFMKENIFRLRLKLDGKRLAEPEPVRLEGFSPGNSYENVQLVRLKCEEGGKFVTTMVTNTRPQSALPLFLSDNGLRFKLASPSLITFADKLLTAPTQMPGPASMQECEAMSMSGVLTQRDLLYSEKAGDGRWLLRRARVRLTLP